MFKITRGGINGCTWRVIISCLMIGLGMAIVFSSIIN